MLWIQFQTSAVKWISLWSESHEFFSFLVHVKVMFTVSCGLLFIVIFHVNVYLMLYYCKNYLTAQLIMLFSRYITLLQMAIFLFLWWLSNIPLWVCVYIYITSSLSIHILGHFSCFHVLAIVRSAAVNIGARESFWNRVFISSGYVPRSGIAGSCGDSIFSF